MAQALMFVLWPSFLVAILAEGLFFSLFDPHDLPLRGGGHLQLSPLAVYSLGFFGFWILCALACLISRYLATAPAVPRTAS